MASIRPYRETLQAADVDQLSIPRKAADTITKTTHLRARRLRTLLLPISLLLLSFLFTLWLTKPNPLPQSINTSQLLESVARWKVPTEALLTQAAQEAGLHLSKNMVGSVDALRRVSDTEVAMAGWAADIEGNETPLHVIVFVRGDLVAKVQTKGEFPPATALYGLAFGSEKNVLFQANFPCRPNEQPLVIAVGTKQNYHPLKSQQCP
jgi:hypothetical protein